MARVLVIEDDAAINDVVTTRLSRDGHAVTQAFSGSEARLLLGGADGKGAGFDVVVCDLMLPGATGEELVGLIRGRDAATPIVVISARTTPADRVGLLRLGADDYLTKPFDLDELAARVEVQLRHRGGEAPAAGEALRWHRWSLDPEARTLSVAPGAGGEPGGDVPLTKIEFNILEALVRRPNKVFSKSELFELAWGEPFAGDDSVVAVHVSNIRAKLRATGTDAYLRTVWGMGFKLAS
ncbi:response regulator transcription factor [Olsenella sp. An290]|uniref:response regulator transcription factor n=1 Tax=Olsenella sp. An290 TaxID=1965625 RepID=UPI000B37A6FE|nr:response regulator transcription factor [Olsenella sp. An290]OUO35222.1 DNA-binding response regulator [Olsenella sp. An290]